jgi:MFS family permease
LRDKTGSNVSAERRLGGGAEGVRLSAGPLKHALRHRDFRLLWSAQILSELGDWAARVALAVLVFDRTHSKVLTAFVMAVGLMPWIGIGQALATLADRYPRRAIMVTADAMRAVAFAGIVVVEPVWAVLVLAFIAATASPPFEAARAALIADVVPEDDYHDALTVGNITYQSVLVIGYVAGGGLVAVLGAGGALLVNAGSFLVSAVLLIAVQGGREHREGVGMRASVARAARTLMTEPYLRRAAAIAMIGGSAAVVGESLVVIYVRDHIGTGNGAIGILSAAVPVGTILAAAFSPRKGSHAKLLRVSASLVAIGSALAIVGFLITPPNMWAVLAYGALGIVPAMIIPAQAVVGTRVPADQRASIFGLLQGTLLGGQAIASIGGGFLARAVGAGPATAFALMPALGYAVYAIAVPPREPDAGVADLDDAGYDAPWAPDLAATAYEGAWESDEPAWEPKRAATPPVGGVAEGGNLLDAPPE